MVIKAGSSSPKILHSNSSGELKREKISSPPRLFSAPPSEQSNEAKREFSVNELAAQEARFFSTMRQTSHPTDTAENISFVFPVKDEDIQDISKIIRGEGTLGTSKKLRRLKHTKAELVELTKLAEAVVEKVELAEAAVEKVEAEQKTLKELKKELNNWAKQEKLSRWDSLQRKTTSCSQLVEGIKKSCKDGSPLSVPNGKFPELPELPSEFKVDMISLPKGQLTKLPDTLYRTGVRFLNLPENLINELPSNFESKKWKDIMIDLSHNKLSAADAFKVASHQMTAHAIVSKQINEEKEEQPQFDHDTLSLRSLNLEEIPDPPSDLRVKKIDLSLNNLTTLSTTLRGLFPAHSGNDSHASLGTIVADYNQIPYLKDEFLTDKWQGITISLLGHHTTLSFEFTEYLLDLQKTPEDYKGATIIWPSSDGQYTEILKYIEKSSSTEIAQDTGTLKSTESYTTKLSDPD